LRYREGVRRCQSLALGLLLFLTADPRGQALAPATLPPLPFEDIGACPFEGCSYREWIARESIEIKRDRASSSPVAFELAAGEVVTAVTGTVITVVPGILRVSTPVTLETLQGVLTVSPQDTVYLLTYEGEGFYKAWFKGRLHSMVDVGQISGGGCRVAADCAGRIVAEPTMVWWVQIRNAKGQVGWTDRPELFDNQDALA